DGRWQAPPPEKSALQEREEQRQAKRKREAEIKAVEDAEQEKRMQKDRQWKERWEAATPERPAEIESKILSQPSLGNRPPGPDSPLSRIRCIREFRSQEENRSTVPPPHLSPDENAKLFCPKKDEQGSWPKITTPTHRTRKNGKSRLPS